MKKRGRKKPYKYGTGEKIESPEDLFERAPYNFFIEILRLAKQRCTAGLRNREFRWILNKPHSKYYPRYKIKEIMLDKFDGVKLTTKYEQRGYFLDYLKKVGVPVNSLNMYPQEINKFLFILRREGIVEKDEDDDKYKLSNQYYPRCVKIISKRLIDLYPIDSILFHRDLESVTIYGIDKKLYTEKDITRIEEKVTPVIKNAIKALQDIKSDRVVDYWKELIKPVEKLSIPRDLINTIKGLYPFHIYLLLWDDVSSKKKWIEETLSPQMDLNLDRYNIDKQQKKRICSILWDATKKTQERFHPKTGITLVVTAVPPYGAIELKCGEGVAEIW